MLPSFIGLRVGMSPKPRKDGLFRLSIENGPGISESNSNGSRFLAPAVVLLFTLFTNTDTFAQTCDSTTDIGGHIFRDYNSDGAQTGTEPDFGDAGIQVTAYDSNNTAVATASVGNDGQYFLPLLGDGNDYRLEFVGLPDYLEFGAIGTDSDSSVRFVTGATCAVDVGVFNPSDYCDTDADLITTCFINDGVTVNPDSPAVVRFERGDGSLATSGRTDYLEFMDEVGSTYGVAYQRTQDLVFVGAFAKRHSAWGPAGPGGIYVIQNSSIAPTDPSNIAATITIPNAGSSARAVDGPALIGNCDTAATGTDYLRDSCFFDSVGKEGLGDVQISDDEKTLWTVNLFDRHLYEVDISPGSGYPVIDRGAIADPGCSGGADDWRPFALEYHDGELYVGGVCSGQSGNAFASRDASTSPDTVTDNIAQVSAHIAQFTDPKVSSAAVEVFRNTNMGFNRGRNTSYPPADNDGRWHAWLTTYDVDLMYVGDRPVLVSIVSPC